jgi:hypothetical protein
MVICGGDDNLHNYNVLSFLPACLTCVAAVWFTQQCCTHQQLHNAYIIPACLRTRVQVNITLAMNCTARTTNSGESATSLRLTVTFSYLGAYAKQGL